jgi:vacuolar-type H+-ATPase catalytic subunit A/Vma1
VVEVSKAVDLLSGSESPTVLRIHKPGNLAVKIQSEIRNHQKHSKPNQILMSFIWPVWLKSVKACKHMSNALHLIDLRLDDAVFNII